MESSKVPGLLVMMALIAFTIYGLLAMLPASGAGRLAVPRPEEHRWHQYVRASDSRVIRPKEILGNFTTGNVENAQRILGGDGAARLARNGSVDDVPSLVVDFGQNTVGILSIEFDGADGDGQAYPGLRLAFSETLEHLSDRSDFTRSFNAPEGSPDKLTSGTDQIAVKTSPYTWTDQLGCQHGTQVCSDGLHGFRYAKISLDALPEDAPYTTSTGHVNIKSLSLRLSAFHGTPDTFAGWFECSDEELSQWWYDGVYTNDLCIDVFRRNDTEPRDAFSESLDGKLVLHDAPKRDRDPYVGDVAVSGLTTYLSRDIRVWTAARNVLADLAEHQRAADGFIPPASIFNYTLPLYDYPLWWVVCSYDYVMHSGDMAYLEDYYHTLVRVLDGFYPSSTNPETHLLEKLAGYGDYGFIPRDGPVTYYNALYILALKHASALAGFTSHEDDRDRWASRADQVSEALNRHNFDETAGAFYDGTCDGGAYCETHAQDGNSLAILAGVANASRTASILRHRDERCRRAWGNSFYDNGRLGPDHAERVYAFTSFFEVSARFETADQSASSSSALEQARRTWGYMAGRDPGVTFWEGTGSIYNSDPYRSMAHGWATGIVPLLSRYVLGVTPTRPGFRTWMVKPRPGDLSWARGVVPIGHGGGGSGIEVSWTRSEDGCFRLEVRADGTDGGKVAVPFWSQDSEVRVDGEVIWDKSGAKRDAADSSTVVLDEDGYVVFSVGQSAVVDVVSETSDSQLR